MSTNIKFTGELPFNYKPRGYQIPLLAKLDSGCKRAIAIWHRRSGKDKTVLNYVARCMQEKVGTYYYLFPTYKQGRKVIWDGIDNNGFKFTDHFPEQLVEKRNEQEMKVTYKNGSIFQIVGTDDVDSIVGTNPIFCVFSEYSISDPKAWGYIRPILAANGGTAVFIYTPRGRGHGWNLLQYAKTQPEWFTEILTVDDTKSISQEILESERQGIIADNGDDALFFQEYYCSFDAPMQGSYYGKLLELAEKEGRIGMCPYDPTLPVHTIWDIGVGDATAIWFLQVFGKELRLIDYYENSGEGLPFYVRVLQDKKYVYKNHYAPHDIEVREFSSGVSRFETAQKLGIRFLITPKLSIEDGIDAVRAVFPYLIFDKKKCEEGLVALYAYHKEYDEKRQQFKSQPLHDWSSNCCFSAGTKIKMIDGEKNIEDIRIGDQVNIDGVKGLVTAAGLVKTARTINVLFSDGTTLNCTPDHKIFTTRGLVYADELRYDDYVHTINSRLWDLKSFAKNGIREELTSYIKTLNIGFGKKENSIVHNLKTNKGSYIGSSGKIGKTQMEIMILEAGLKWCQLMGIGLTLKLQTGVNKLKELKETSRINMNGKSLMDINFIKSRTTDTSTINTLGSSCTGMSGNFIMEKYKKAIKSTTRTMINLTIRLRIWLLSLIQTMLLSMQKQASGLAAKEIENNLEPQGPLLQNCVRVVSVSAGSLSKVYDITVDKHHCYYANGVLVSNSDALRYLAVNFKYIMRTEMYRGGKREERSSMDKFDRFSVF